MRNPADILHRGLVSLGHFVSREIEQTLLNYITLLLKWNKAYNLTAVRDQHEAIVRHLLDSLVVGPYLNGQRIIDVGTGAGLPGIPLALCYPDHAFTLLDSNGKKIQFLLHARQVLPLANVNVVHGRAETFTPKHSFTSVVSRAFASIENMLTLTEHLAAATGQFLAMKASYPTAEIEAIPQKFIVTHVHQLTVPGLEAERHLVCIRRREIQ